LTENAINLILFIFKVAFLGTCHDHSKKKLKVTFFATCLLKMKQNAELSVRFLAKHEVFSQQATKY
jgi:hypothetical protein